MQMMPFSVAASPEGIVTPTISTVPLPTQAEWPEWRTNVPTLIHRRTRLRELRPSDALPLLSLLTTEEVTRFIAPPPFRHDAR